MRQLIICFVAVLATGCVAPSERPAHETFLFDGNLVSIAGQSSTASIRVEITGQEGDARPVAYAITSGCRLSGISMDGTHFNGSERLSRCSLVEVETLARLEAMLSGPSEMNLSIDAAELVTPGGSIRFERVT
ncbi:hypothetical protein ACO2Q1_09095 [Brevundimonas sp. VNH65]|uniref:hypothetical protein n=1 Tax=Brevundimonas sp. VNH65 TaxID=3400917 RepID=UPI003C0E792C